MRTETHSRSFLVEIERPILPLVTASLGLGLDGKLALLLQRLLPETAFEALKRRLFSSGKTAVPHVQTQPHETAASDEAAAP